MISSKKKSIVFLGYSHFPYGFAEVQKIILIAKSLLVTGNNVTVLSRNGYHNKAKYPEMKNHDFYEGIEYIYSSGSCFRNENFLKRRFFQLKGKIKEVLILRKMKKCGNLDFAILSTRSFYLVLFYNVLSKIFHFKIILNYVEYYSAMKKNKFQISKRLNDKLFDKYASSLSDAVFPISEFLIQHINKVSPGKKYLKIPGLTDFGKYTDIEVKQDQKYFLFCGDARYKEIVLFIIDSFGLLNNTSVYLYLIISGDENSISIVKKYINHQFLKDQIQVFSNISEKQLYTYYKNALSLLIPLRPTFQDIARFPHKTGEYLASGNPVISTNYGEVKYYFTDMVNMLLADNYDIQLFAEKMQYVLNNPLEAKRIGDEGKNVAINIFDFRNRAGVINEFLQSAI